MFNKWIKNKKELPAIIKLIAIIEMIGGAIGTITSFIHMFTVPPENFISLLYVPISNLLLTAAFLFITYAGYKLWKNSSSGYELSIYAQMIQLPYIVSNFFAYYAFSGVALQFAYTIEGFEKILGMGTQGRLDFGDGYFQAIGINLVAVLFLFCLQYYYSEKINSMSYYHKSIKKLLQIIRDFLSSPDFRFKPNKLIKIIALFQLLGGSLGMISIVLNFVNIEVENVTNKHTILFPLPSLLYFLLYFLVAYAGYQLVQGSNKGYKLSMLSLILQVPFLDITHFHYEFVSLFAVFLGFAEHQFVSSFLPGSEYLITYIHENYGPNLFAVNILAAAFLAILRYKYSEHKILSQKVKKIN